MEATNETDSMVSMVSAMELPCYLSLSENAVKIGNSGFDEIQDAAFKLNFIFTQMSTVCVEFDPAIATWSGHSIKKESMWDDEYSLIKFEFVMCLWQREGILLLETEYSGCKRMFDKFYRTTLSKFVESK